MHRMAAETVEPEASVVQVMDVGRMGADQAREWDSFVAATAEAGLCHLSRWQGLIQDLFGHEIQSVVARDLDGRLVGILPLVRLRSRLFGDYRVSMPYLNQGGALGLSPEIEQTLMETAAARAQAEGSTHIEFRDLRQRPGWVARTDKVALELPLPADAEHLWKALGGKLRAQVRRPQREPVEVLTGGGELLDDFYQVFARNMRDLGTPVYPYRFFAAILAAFPASARIVVVRYRQSAAAAAFLLDYRGRMEIPWASSIREYNPIGVNMLLYWEALKLAIERGNHTFDFGRSTRDSGTYRFKTQWGAQPRQLYWHYWLPEGREPPRLNPDNPKYRLAIRAWRRLPLAVANRLGPMIVKNLP